MVAVGACLNKHPGMPESADDIARCDACGSSMNVTTVAPFANVECPACHQHMRVKCKFGPYTLLRRHAIGGMSVVFVAHDAMLDREVAVKILNQNYSADARRIVAFEEEARITASFTHPNVVRVFTTGRAFKRFFIAMEFVSGGHFEHQILKRGKIPEMEMLPLAIQVAEGLKAAHAAGLIHRDIKPGNILLDSEGHAKIVDFGLALLLGKGGSVQAQEFWATPYYVPPETIEGHAEDFRSDMYAFGATVYHALAGKPPCNEESMATNILREAKRKVVPLHSFAPWVSPLTSAVVDRAMAYDSAKRFESYDALIALLNQAQKQLRVATSTSRAGAAGTWRGLSNSKRGARVFTLAGGAAIIAAVAGSAWWVTRKTPQPGAQPAASQAANHPSSNHAAAAGDLEDATRIARHYREARGAMKGKDYDKARKLFALLRDDAAVQEPTRTWAGVEAVVMSYLEGKSSEARKEAKITAAHTAGAQLADPSVKGLLLPLLENLPDLPAIAEAPRDISGASTPQAMAWLLAALKNWEQGSLAEAAVLFTAVSGAGFDPEDPMKAIYQKVAGDYLADFKSLTSPVFARAPRGKAACLKAIDELDAMKATLKTRGRAHFNVGAWKLDLGKLARQAEVPSGTTVKDP